jgi:hypothetical protein
MYSEPTSLFFVEQQGAYMMLDCEFAKRGDYVPGYTVSVVPMSPQDRFEEAERLAMLTADFEYLH